MENKNGSALTTISVAFQVLIVSVQAQESVEKNLYTFSCMYPFQLIWFLELANVFVNLIINRWIFIRKPPVRTLLYTFALSLSFFSSLYVWVQSLTVVCRQYFRTPTLFPHLDTRRTHIHLVTFKIVWIRITCNFYDVSCFFSVVATRRTKNVVNEKWKQMMKSEGHTKKRR